MKHHIEKPVTWVQAALAPRPMPSPWQHCWFHALMCMQNRHLESTWKEKSQKKVKVQQVTNRLCTALLCACRTKKEVLCLTSTQPSRRRGEHDIPATLTHTSLTCCSSWLPAQLGQSVPEYPRAEVAGLQGHGYTHRVSSASPYTQQKEWGLQQTDQPLFASCNSHQMKTAGTLQAKL